MFFVYDKGNAVFSLVVWIHTSLKEIMSFANTKEHDMVAESAAASGWEHLEMPDLPFSQQQSVSSAFSFGERWVVFPI